MVNNLELREINKLIKEQFYIPTYQRGYRWDEKQVTDLLEDIHEFMDKGNVQAGEFYCLQPIVVKKREEVYVFIALFFFFFNIFTNVIKKIATTCSGGIFNTICPFSKIFLYYHKSC